MSKVQPGMPEHRGLADRIKTLEAQVARLSRARTMQSTSLDGGTFRVKGGGTIEILDGSGNVIHTFDINGMTVFEADGSTLMQLDGTGIRLNDGSGTKLIDLTTAGLKAYEADGSTLVILDGSKLRFNRADGTRQLEITPAGGLKIYDTNGTTEKVVLNAAGLAIDGIIQPALQVLTESDADNVTVTTTETTVCEITFTIPSWADEVSLLTMARLTAGSNSSGSTLSLVNKLVNDVGGLASTTTDNFFIPDADKRSSMVALSTTVTSPGSTITCRQRVDILNASGTIPGEVRLEGLAIVRRTS